MENVLVGDLKYNGITGKLNDSGNFIGVWNMKVQDSRNDKEYIAEFNNNIFSKLIIRQISSGDINFKYDNSEIVKQFSESKKNQLQIGNKNFVLKSCKDLDRYWGEDDDAFFIDFLKILNEKLCDFDSTIKDIQIGSENFVLNSPQIVRIEKK